MNEDEDFVIEEEEKGKKKRKKMSKEKRLTRHRSITLVNDFLRRDF
jgi:hypothetical protein